MEHLDEETPQRDDQAIDAVLEAVVSPVPTGTHEPYLALHFQAFRYC